MTKLWHQARAQHNRRTPTSRPMTTKTIGEKRPYGVHCPHGYAECRECARAVADWQAAATLAYGPPAQLASEPVPCSHELVAKYASEPGIQHPPPDNTPPEAFVLRGKRAEFEFISERDELSAEALAKFTREFIGEPEHMPIPHWALSSDDYETHKRLHREARERLLSAADPAFRAPTSDNDCQNCGNPAEAHTNDYPCIGEWKTLKAPAPIQMAPLPENYKHLSAGLFARMYMGTWNE